MTRLGATGQEMRRPLLKVQRSNSSSINVHRGVGTLTRYQGAIMSRPSQIQTPILHRSMIRIPAIGKQQVVNGFRNGNLARDAEASHASHASQFLIAEKSRASQVVAGGR
jgi:hypothetical protein